MEPPRNDPSRRREQTSTKDTFNVRNILILSSEKRETSLNLRDYVHCMGIIGTKYCRSGAFLGLGEEGACANHTLLGQLLHPLHKATPVPSQGPGVKQLLHLKDRVRTTNCVASLHVQEVLNTPLNMLLQVLTTSVFSENIPSLMLSGASHLTGSLIMLSWFCLK